MSQATQELIWLNEKEEEEVAFDWSDHNSSIFKKREYHAVCLETNSTERPLSWLGLVVRDDLSLTQDLMRELDEKEGVFKSVQDKGEHLIRKNHPAGATIEVSFWFGRYKRVM